jgi:hypothetical protein
MNARGGLEPRANRGQARTGLSGFMGGAFGHGATHSRDVIGVVYSPTTRCAATGPGWPLAVIYPSVHTGPGGCGTRRQRSSAIRSASPSGVNVNRGVPDDAGQSEGWGIRRGKEGFSARRASILVPDRLIWSRNLCPHCAH